MGTLLASLTLSGPDWLLPAGAVLAAALGILSWSYRTATTGQLRWVCLGLKLLGIAALAFCLLEPLWTGQRARPGSNLFAVVADNSQGMTIRDAGDKRSRGEAMRELLDPGRANWPGQLAGDFEVRRYLFDARLQNTRDFGELNFDGRSSAIGLALRTLAERYQGRPLAGVLLFTDGNATDIHGALPDLTGLPPVYPVIIGRRDAVKDISLQQVAVSQTVFEDAPVSVQAEVSAAGFSGEKVVAQLRDRAGKVVNEQTVRTRVEGEAASMRFQVKPEKPGVSFYQLRVGTEGEIGQGANATNSAEATLVNNSRVIVADRGQGPFRILYVAGRPNWEFKFLNRAVAEDDQIQLVGLIRIAKREPKFEFRGRAGETGNPLFRGFGDQTREAAERYDQPVLTRLNTRDEVELRGGFPRTAEELYGYQAVIVDDLEAEFFAPEQAQLLQRFVSERGGGFLMLGGMESFQQGQYQRTPIGDMLPVYLDRPAESAVPGPMRFSLAREGWLQSWARLRDNEADERTRLDEMPKFEVMNTVREVKPGASVIATAADESGKEHPALAVQRFGRGRTGALMVGDVWR
ncbi:MAG TPA: glutamine amidotransferase, partial [Candidatus Limnocylindria bacterium]|nr:glutamine amidotransferase [Candidatus Limnocylindria bacterium]